MSLKDKIIISTRPEIDEDILFQSLSEKGAIIYKSPMIKIVQSELNVYLKNVISNIKDFDWLIFTSPNAVHYLFRFIDEFDVSISNLKKIKFACFGTKTCSEAEKYGIVPIIKSFDKTSEIFLKELLAHGFNSNEKTLLVMGELASDLLEEGLKSSCSTQRINVYKTLPVDNISDEILLILRESRHDMIIFTSPSAFRNFQKIIQSHNITTELKIACIGLTTAKEVENTGLSPILVSQKPDGMSFAKEIENYFNN